jgi:hypothetical protein
MVFVEALTAHADAWGAATGWSDVDAAIGVWVDA